jgi:hypothetical protein
MIRIGFLAGKEAPVLYGQKADEPRSESEPEPRPQARRVQGARHCPRCSSASYVKEGACWVCRSCGFSRCG